MAKGNEDLYSDIDLHIIVKPDSLREFIRNKRKRPTKWGKVLFFEDFSPSSPVVVSHFSSFVKVDSWYKTIDQVQPSIWLKGLRIIHDSQGVLTTIFQESTRYQFELTEKEVDFWKGKLLAFIHETYRSAMRKDYYYALSNLDRIRWLVASGWYMEAGRHLDTSYGVWSKIKGARSHLSESQQRMLNEWHCRRDSEDILNKLAQIAIEVIRLNKSLCEKAGIENHEAEFKRIIEMVI